RQREGAVLVRVERTDADELMGDFLAAVVEDGHNDGVFPGFALGGVPDAAFDAQRRERRRLRFFDTVIEAQVVPASRTHACAFEDRLAAVRTLAGRPGAA